MFNNYISVSFQIGKSADSNGCVFVKIKGKFTFDELKKAIVTFAKAKYGYDIEPKDINITGISKISSTIYNRLVK